MKFFGHGIVWDAERNKVLCDFGKNREIETEDVRVADLLASMGHASEGEITSNKITSNEIVNRHKKK